MSSASPPKPWERGFAAPLSSAPATTSKLAPNTSSSTVTATGSSQTLSLPPRPPYLNAAVNRPALNYSPYGAASTSGLSPYAGVGSYSNFTSPYSRIGGFNNYSSPYSQVGAYNNYTSPYSRFGAMNNSMYSGLAGGMYGGGIPGAAGQPSLMGMDPNDPNSLTNNLGQSTLNFLQIFGSLASAFGGFAQLFESAHMTTHSSVLAIVSIAEQLSSIRTMLGSVLGIFHILHYFRTLFAKVTGRPPPADPASLTPSAFAAFHGFSPGGSLANQTSTLSKKAFFILVLAIFGFPYLILKFIHSRASSQPQPSSSGAIALGPDGTPLPGQQPLDLTQLEFGRVLHDYNPEPATDESVRVDLPVKQGDLVAVLHKCDPMGQPSEWWRCRARGGRVGWLPGIILEPIKRRERLENGRLASMGSTESTVDSLNVEGRSAHGASPVA